MGQARFPAGPRAFVFSRFQSEKKGLSRVKKLKAFSLFHGVVVVKAVVLKMLKERESIQPFQ